MRLTPDLRLGRWQDVLADVLHVNAVITDAPFSARTHDGHDSGVAQVGERRALAYDPWGPEDVFAFVASWSPRCDGWIVAMTSHDLIPAWEEAYRDTGRLPFAPVPIIQARVRHCGDGPASCAVYAMAARPRTSAWIGGGERRSGALPGWYDATKGTAGHIGGKPLGLMRAVVRDYSRPGDIVCDPCMGYGTTLRAALLEGRRSVGAEVDPDTYRAACGIGPDDGPPLLPGLLTGGHDGNLGS